MSARESDRLAALQQRAAEIVTVEQYDSPSGSTYHVAMNGVFGPPVAVEAAEEIAAYDRSLLIAAWRGPERGTERTPDDLGGAVWTVDSDSKADDLHLDGSLIATAYHSGRWLVWRPERTAPFMSGHTIRAKDAAVEELRRAGILPRKSPAAQQPVDWSSIAELRAALADVGFGCGCRDGDDCRCRDRIERDIIAILARWPQSALPNPHDGERATCDEVTPDNVDLALALIENELHHAETAAERSRADGYYRELRELRADLARRDVVAAEAMHELLHVDASMNDRKTVAERVAKEIGHRWPPYDRTDDEEEAPAAPETREQAIAACARAGLEAPALARVEDPAPAPPRKPCLLCDDTGVTLSGLDNLDLDAGMPCPMLPHPLRTAPAPTDPYEEAGVNDHHPDGASTDAHGIALLVKP